MTQSRKHSSVEVLTGTFTGFVGSWLITFWIVSLHMPPPVAATWTVSLCTVWSLVRGYAVRRYFATRVVHPPSEPPAQPARRTDEHAMYCTCNDCITGA